MVARNGSAPFYLADKQLIVRRCCSAEPLIMTRHTTKVLRENEIIPIEIFAMQFRLGLVRAATAGLAFWNATFSFPPNDEWPPISEDEFIRRCSPGVDRERALRVRRIIAEQLDIDYDRIYPEQRFVEDLGCD